MYKVAVVMSTFNGEKYLIEQLESIFAQSDVKIDLYVRDDGSIDETSKLLELAMQKHQNLHVDYGENIGVGNSFMTILFKLTEDYDYYAFADQDDVWLSEKIITGINKLRGKSLPALYASNQIVTDKYLHKQTVRFSEPPEIKYGNIIRGNQISGCTFIFNKKLFCFLTEPENRPTPELLSVRIHDVWVAVIAALFGEIIFDMDSHILYRQHENNVVGVNEKSLCKILKLKIKRIFCIELCQGGITLAQELYSVFQDKLGDNEKKIYSYATYRNSARSKRRLIGMYNDLKNSDENIVEYFCKILLNRF